MVVGRVDIMLWLLVFTAITVVYVGLLLGIIAGRPFLVSSFETAVSVIPVVTVPYFICAFFANQELCSSDGMVLIMPAPDGVDDMSKTPAALFAALFVQALLQVVSATVRKMFVTPALTVHFITFLYYSAEVCMPSCTLASRWPDAHMGVGFLHYALWSTSISAQCFTLFSIKRSLTPRAQLEALDSTATPDHRNVCLALLGVQGMLWTGALGEIYPQVTGSLILLTLSFYFFYMLIVTGIWRPLSGCRRQELESPDSPQCKYRARRYRAIAIYLTTAWHGFPVVWLANECGWASGDRVVRIGYVAMDVLSKFIPPSLYITYATAE